MSRNGWIGVDLDGTLAHYESWDASTPYAIGEPIPKMVARVRKWIDEGQEVRIFTARVCVNDMRGTNEAVLIANKIQDWTEKHIGLRLAVTNVKDYAMIELWDDRAVGVQKNTGLTFLEYEAEERRKRAIDHYDRGYSCGRAKGREEGAAGVKPEDIRRDAYEAGVTYGRKIAVQSTEAFERGRQAGYADGWGQKHTLLTRLDDVAVVLDRAIQQARGVDDGEDDETEESDADI